jgi:hypothetical protein
MGSKTITCHLHVASYHGVNIRKFSSLLKIYPNDPLTVRYINVKDDAPLHVAALTFEDFANERIFAMAETFFWKFAPLSLPNELLLSHVTVR